MRTSARCSASAFYGTTWHWLGRTALSLAFVITASRADVLAQPISGPEGHWVITWSDYPADEESRMGWLTLGPPLHLECQEATDGSCLWRVAPNPEAPLRLAGQILDNDGQLKGYNTSSIEVGSGAIKVRHGYFTLGWWGGTSEVLQGGPDEYRGRWTYDDEGGAEIWQRVHPTIERVKIRAGFAEAAEAGPGEYLIIRMPWVDKLPGGDMPGNRPRLWLEVHGTDLWGEMGFDATGAPGLQPYVGRRDITREDAAGGPDKTLAGFATEFIVWPEVRPGLQFLRIADIDIPVFVDLAGYPGPDPDLEDLPPFNDACVISVGDSQEDSGVLEPFGQDFLNSIGDRFGELQQRYFNGSVEQRAAIANETRMLLEEIAAAIAQRQSVQPPPDVAVTLSLQSLFDNALTFRKEIADQAEQFQGQSEYGRGFLPRFPEGSSGAERSERWLGALSRVRKHYNARDNAELDWQQLAAWQARRDELLTDLMLIEEEIVWEAASPPFTEDEIHELQAPFGGIAATRTRLAEVAKNDPEIARLVELLDEYDREIVRVLNLSNSDTRYLGLLAAGNHMCRVALEDMEGRNDAAKREIAELMNKVEEGFLNVIESRRKRGIEQLRLMQSGGEPFRIHRPASGRNGLGPALARRIQEVVSGGTALSFGDDFAQAVVETDPDWAIALDLAETDRLLR